MFDIMFIRQKRNEARDSFESRHTDSLSTRITVQTAARYELTRADLYSLWSRCISSVTCTLSRAVRYSQCETLEFREEHKPNRRNPVCNEMVRRHLNLHIAIIYYGLTVLVTLTAPWHCGRKCGIFKLHFITRVMV